MDTVEIKYIESSLAARYGTGKKTVKRGLAEHLESKGWAKIISGPPVANPSPTSNELDEIKKKYEEDTVAYMLEEKLLTKVAWVCGDFINVDIRRIGEKCGFKITIVNPSNLTPGKLLLSDVIIVSSKLKGFSEIQLIQIRSIIFQKNVPYVFKADGEFTFNEMNKHLIMDAKLNVFNNNVVFENAVEEMGEIFSDRWFIETGDGYRFWKQISDCLKS